MRVWIALAILLVLPGAAACKVTPIMEFHLDDAPRCTLFQHEACDPVPGPGDPRVYHGTVRWYWDVDECTTQSGVMQDDMEITFSGSGNNPAWLGLTFEPERIVIPMAEYYDPTYIQTDGERIYSEKEAAFTVTFDFLRAPDESERDAIEQREGLVMAFLKAKAEGEGAREAFAIKQVGFDAANLVAGAPTGARGEGAGEDAPLPVLPGLLALVGLAAWRSRMRR